jgi:hypothetical protein
VSRSGGRAAPADGVKALLSDDARPVKARPRRLCRHASPRAAACLPATLGSHAHVSVLACLFARSSGRTPRRRAAWMTTPSTARAGAAARRRG